MTLPANGSIVGGTISLVASATDNVGVTKVEFYHDGGVLIDTDITAPYSISFNTATGSDGAHSFYAKAYDAANNVGTSSSVSVTVDNTLPSTSLTSPVSGGTVSGTISLVASASDNVGVNKVEFYYDSILLGIATTAPYTSPLDTTTLVDGSHNFYTKAYDLVLNSATSSVNLVTVSNSTAGEWSRSFGNSGEDRGLSVAVDDMGSVVVTGYFSGTVDFGGGPLTSVLASPVLGPSKDVFLAKYSASGIHLWSRQLGANADDQGNSVVVDSNGDVVVTGSCANRVDFGDGNVTSSFGGYDIFVAKYSGVDGSLLWAKRFGGIYDDYGYGVAVDSSDNIIVTGFFMEQVNFGGGALNSAGGGDIFVAKFSSSGTHIWSKRLGGVNSDAGYSVGVDDNGNVVVVGWFAGTVDFGGGPLTSVGSSYDIFVARYSGTDGNHLWSKRLGSTGADYANGVAMDSNGNITVTGVFEGTVDFGGGGLTSAGGCDIFLAKYSASGVHLWSKRFGSTSTDDGDGVAVDSNGNVIVTGTFKGTVDFGGGGLTSAGGCDIFLAKYSASGAHMWSENFGGTINQFGKAVAVNGNSNVAMTGYFENIVDFGGGIHTSAGGRDIFLTSLMP
jgi:uncharacterized protein (AIM24 family)